MMKSIPPVKRYMTTCPLTVNSDQSLKYAKTIMREHNFRHLPVLEGGVLVGLISAHDIDFISNFSGVDIAKEKIKEAMTTEPFRVEANAGLDEICTLMATEKIGSVLVLENKKLVGIFTWIDALVAMSELMQKNNRE